MRQNEEADLHVTYVPVADCVRAVLDGHIVNSIAAAGILAAARYLDGGIDLRPADAPWPA